MNRDRGRVQVRDPSRPAPLEVTARPVHAAGPRPAPRSTGRNLRELAQALDDFSGVFQAQAQQDSQEEAQDAADRAARRLRGMSYDEASDAVRSGRIAADESPWFNAAFRKQFGQMAAIRSRSAITERYAQFDFENDDLGTILNEIQEPQLEAIEGDEFAEAGYRAGMGNFVQALQVAHGQKRAEFKTGQALDQAFAILDEGAQNLLEDGKSTEEVTVWLRQELKARGKTFGIAPAQLDGVMLQLADAAAERGQPALAIALVTTDRVGENGQKIPALAKKRNDAKKAAEIINKSLRRLAANQGAAQLAEIAEHDVQLLMDGRGHQIDDIDFLDPNTGAPKTRSEKNRINAALALAKQRLWKNEPLRYLDLLARNGLKDDEIGDLLEQGALGISLPDIDAAGGAGGVPEVTTQAVLLGRQLKARSPTLFDSHISDPTARQFYAGVEIFGMLYGEAGADGGLDLSRAILATTRALADPDFAKRVKSETFSQDIEREVRALSSGGWFGRDARNQGQLRDLVSNAAEWARAFGVSSKQAVKWAADAIGGRFVNIEGVMVPAFSSNLPENLPEHAAQEKEAVKEIAARFEVDESDLAFLPLNREMNQWMVHDVSTGVPRALPGASIKTPRQLADSLVSSDLKGIAGFISKGEGAGYDTPFGGSKVRPPKALSAMTVDEVIGWQKQSVKAGSKSSAAGRYQIIRKTLEGLKKEMKLSGTETFDETLQDRMFATLLKRRGLDQFQKGEISLEQFADRVAKEWASMPLKSGASAYQGVAGNKATVSRASFLDALKTLKKGDSRKAKAQSWLQGQQADLEIKRRLEQDAANAAPDLMIAP